MQNERFSQVQIGVSSGAAPLPSLQFTQPVLFTCVSRKGNRKDPKKKNVYLEKKKYRTQITALKTLKIS